MNNLKAYGAHLAGEAHRNGKKRHANHIKNRSNVPCPNTNIFPITDYEKLGLLALKMACDCFSLKPSGEVIRDFIIGVDRLRGDL